MNDDFLTKLFWLDARERLIRTFVQVLVATLPAQVVADSITKADWANARILLAQAVTAALAASVSLLWSLIAARKPNTLSPASNVTVLDEPDSSIFELSDEGESYHPDDLPGEGQG